MRTLRQNRSDVWFFWHLTDLARKHAANAYDAYNGTKQPKKRGDDIRCVAWQAGTYTCMPQ